MKYFDMHCDTLYELYHQKESLRDTQKLHINLEKAADFDQYAQFFAMFCGTTEVVNEAEAAYRLESLLEIAEREFAENEKSIQLCHTGKELQAVQQAGKTAAFLTVEGADLLPNEKMLCRAGDAGVRLVTITWNHRNRYGCPACLNQQEGLTAEGFSFVRSCEEKKILVDASHLSDAGFYDLLRKAQRPFVASHSNSRAVCPAVRNVTDEMFRELVDMGGVLGINLCPSFLYPKDGGRAANIEDIIRHIDHLLELGGENTLCMGADWDGIDALPDGMESLSSVPLLRNALQARGYSEKLLNKIFYDNLADFVSRWL